MKVFILGIFSDLRWITVLNTGLIWPYFILLLIIETDDVHEVLTNTERMMAIGIIFSGILIGLGFAVAALLSGLPIWVAVTVYVGTGGLWVLGGVAFLLIRASGEDTPVQSAVISQHS